MPDAEFAALLQRATVAPALRAGVAALAEHAPLAATFGGTDARRRIEAIIGELDRVIAAQLDLVLHHPEFQQVEASWRGLRFLVGSTETGPTLKIRLLDIGKRELARSLRKFRGTAWDQSPLFRRVYEEEYGQFGGEPFGVLVGDYFFDQRPEDVQLLADIAQVAAAAHVPFIAAAAPSVMQMESWAELANPRDLSRIFLTPEYAAWRSFRDGEDARYIGLCLPRFLARLPYGARTEPADGFDFEEDVEGPDARRYLWANAAYAMAANIARAFSLYGWCVRIRGIDGGGAVAGLPVLTFATADGDVDRRCSIEVALSERREAELARNGFIPLVHRRGEDCAAFIGAQSLQRPQEYSDPAATANAALAARLPYLFACCRFAHYLKCMVRDKIGSARDRGQLQNWLTAWLRGYIDGSPDDSTEQWKASHPLIEAEVTVESREDLPGQYEARFFLRPHFQLEGLTAALRLVSRLPAQ
ncbi:MAG: type VI secretion system contractile sheath large subunit [Rhodospirillales bacterium]|nr:type VI secretion system contractile sheath large subunit [Rhodospirillales bacterium]